MNIIIFIIGFFVGCVVSFFVYWLCKKTDRLEDEPAEFHYNEGIKTRSGIKK